MDLIKDANLAVRFLLELAALAALGYWGYRTGTGPATKIALAVGAPLLAGTVWALFVAPKASIPVSEPVHLLLQVAVFGCAFLALIHLGQRTPAQLFGVIAVANAALMAAWHQ